MTARINVALIALPVLLAGCTSPTQFRQQMEPVAVAEAKRRAAFELNCPDVTATLLSSETLQPEVRTFIYTGPERAVYNVGVSGCGKRATYVVICPDNGDNACFDGGSRAEVEQN